MSNTKSEDPTNEKHYAIKETLLVIGNGPSSKDIDFNHIKKLGLDTFCLNSSYRMFDKLNFYPTYFGCFDNIVTENHRENFQKLINESPIKTFFFLKKFNGKSDKKIHLIPQPVIGKNAPNLCYDVNNVWSFNCSGVSAVHCGISMGYKNILLIGMDANYVDIIDGAVQKNGRLTIKDTPKKNPNYWFDNYQVKGDVYNVPRANKFHIPEWTRLANLAKKNKSLRIVNCSPISKVKDFQFSTLTEEFNKLN